MGSIALAGCVLRQIQPLSSVKTHYDGSYVSFGVGPWKLQGKESILVGEGCDFTSPMDVKCLDLKVK